MDVIPGITESSYAEILRVAQSVYTLDPASCHGPSHWLRVETIDLYVADRTGADVTVVRLFARLHDCCRQTRTGTLAMGTALPTSPPHFVAACWRLTDEQFCPPR